MKTADYWIEAYDSVPGWYLEPRYIQCIMLDSYRAGMEAAAGLLDARAKESNVAGTMLFYGMASTLIRTAAKTAQLPMA